MEKQPLSGSEQKIQEYINRIKAGESKESIFDGLPNSFISSIEAGLNEPKNDLPQKSISEKEESATEALDREQKKALDKERISILKKELGVSAEEDIDPDQLTPENVLRQLAEYCEPHMSAPIEAVQDGTFAGWAKLKIENGFVLLARHASDENHLIKDGKTASSEEMMTSSLFSGGAHTAGAVHTSADVDNWANRYYNYPVYGEFKIPVKDFLQLGKEGKIIIGNLGEAEIVLSGDVAKKYLTKVTHKQY